MGHLKGATQRQRLDFFTYAYKRKLEENRGHNYQYISDEKMSELESKGWILYNDFRNSFHDVVDFTINELEAQELVTKLRAEDNYARIVCGLMKDKQSRKYFSVIYKKK